MRIALSLSALVALGVVGSPAAPTERTVHVTVTDNAGAPVPDLTAADFVVKEGGKERVIVKAERAVAPIKLTLAIEERLTADTNVRMGVFEFMKRVAGAAEISLVTIGLRNTTVVDYTSSLDALVGGINKFTLNPARESGVAEGVLALASGIIESKPQRPMIVLLSLTGGQAGVEARTVLDRLRDSGATMHVVALLGGDSSATPLGSLGEQSGREQVLGDGPKQSGGRRIDVPSTATMPRALQQIANEVLAQYVITYTLPDGVKPDRRFNASLKRRGLSLRAPSAIPAG